MSPDESDSLLARLDPVCEHFEAECLAGRRPQMEAYLQGWEADARQTLFHHLLELEVDYLRRRGESPASQEYHRRFPEYIHLVEEVLVSVTGEKTGAKTSAKTTGFARVATGERTGEKSGPKTGRPDQTAELPADSATTQAALQIEALPYCEEDGTFLPGGILAGRYRIVALLGRGGMGEVYRADDLRLGNPVAVKFLPPNLAGDPQRLAFFLNEVRLARKVSHPNVCRVFDISEAEGRHFLTMEYIDGEDLRGLLRRIGRLPQTKAVELARQMCMGLAAAHENGILHRDLKPDNVMIDGRGRAKITDFGLARLTDDDMTGQPLVGTPAYMAPEQLAKNETSPRSDIYALGLIFYEMLTGRRAHPTNDPREILLLHQRSVSEHHQVLIEQHDRGLADVVTRCLEHDPHDRPADALAVAAALGGGDAIQATLASGQTPTPHLIAATAGSASLPKFEWMLTGLIASGLTVVLLISTSLYREIGLPQQPQVLAAQARGVLTDLGYPTEPQSAAWGYAHDRGYLQFLREQNRPWNALVKQQAAHPAPTYFWYRESSGYMAPGKPDWSGDAFLRVDEHRPPPTAKITSLRLGPEGNLLYLQAAIERSLVDNSANDLQPNSSSDPWRSLFAAAGWQTQYNDGAFHQAPSLQPPPFYADQTAAWTGRGVLADWPEHDVRIEAAAVAGKPVYFEVFGPWNELPSQLSHQRLNVRSPTDGPTRLAGAHPIRAVVLTIWVAGLIIAGVFLARKNLFAGRSDRRGAFRFAAFVFLLMMLVWLLRDTHIAAAEELDQLFTALAGALLGAAFVWTSYAALEPYIRRLWPRSLLGWSRILQGRFIDPVVGRDVLLGAAAGVWIAVMKYLIASSPLWFGWSSDAYPGMINLQPVLGARIAAGEALAAVGLALLYSFFHQLLFLLLLRILLRRELFAGAAFVVFMSLLVSVQYRPLPFTLALTALEMSLTAFLFFRFGLLSVVIMHFVRLMMKWPLTTDLSTWHAETGLFAVAALIPLIAWGLYSTRSLRDRSMPNA